MRKSRKCQDAELIHAELMDEMLNWMKEKHEAKNKDEIDYVSGIIAGLKIAMNKTKRHMQGDK